MIVLLWLACNTSDPAKDTPSPAVEPAPEVMPTLEQDEMGTITIDRSTVPDQRRLKRMSVSQARDSMVRISGGIVWGDEETSSWDTYADTLGVADYQLRVESDRSPSVMFQKFLDDAATATCLAWIQAPGTTFFTTEDPTSMTRSDVRANIVGLRWQIQGKARDSAAPIIDDYEHLFFTAHERTDSLDSSWQTVCVAMFTHPDFFMY